MLEPGNVLLISHRRFFQNEEPRYFLGKVVKYEAGIVKVSGYTFVRDISAGSFIRKDDVRVKLISLTSGSYIVYQLPDDSDCEQARFEMDNDILPLSDGKSLSMNMAEIVRAGHI